MGTDESRLATRGAGQMADAGKMDFRGPWYTQPGRSRNRKGSRRSGSRNSGSVRLNRAVTDLLESRALALWVDAVSEPGQPIQEAILTELRTEESILRHPGARPSVDPVSFYRHPAPWRV